MYAFVCAKENDGLSSSVSVSVSVSVGVGVGVGVGDDTITSLYTRPTSFRDFAVLFDPPFSHSYSVTITATIKQSLCIVSQEWVWALSIEVRVLDYDGSCVGTFVLMQTYIRLACV